MRIKTFNKKISLLLAVAILISGFVAIPITASATDNLKICGVDIGIKPGTHMQFSTADGTNSESGYYYKGTYLAASQCFGFARWAQIKLFGKSDYNGSYYSVSVNGSTSVSAGSLTTSNLKSFITASKPGAHLRTYKNSSGNAHSMVITEITDKGFSIAQANGSNNNEYSRYKQNYVGTFTYTWSSYVNSTYGARGINYIKLPKDYPYNTTTKPATPTGVSHSDVTASSVTLSWKAAAGAKTYRIDRRPAGDNTSYSTIASGITGTSYTDTKNLSAGTLYWYRVYAVNGSETSDKPDQAHGVYTKIPAPTVKQTDNTSSMTVSWKHITGTGSYILLRRRYDENDYTEIKSDITSTSYTDTKNIVSGFKYYYRIKAVSSDGSAKSGASETGGSFSRTAAPSVTVASQNALNISWSVIKGNNTYQYAIQRSENGSDFYEVGRTAGTSYTDTGLTAGSKYYYRIHAMTTDGNWCMTSQTGSGTTSTGHVLGDNFKARITYASNGMNVTKDDDDNVTVRSYNGSNNQIWQFIKLADSSYQIKSVTDGKLLDVYGYGTEKGTNVFACEDNGTYSTNQRWYISLYNGMYRLKPACSECMLDVTGGGNVAEGTNVQIYTWLADGAQDFYINQIYDSESPTINNFQVTNINSNSFKIECDLNDNIGVTGVNVKIYGRGTDHWLNLPATNGHFSYDINTKDFEGPGTYEVSLSAYDQDGNTGESHYDESRFVNAIDFDSIIAQKTEIYNGHIYQLYYVDGMTWNGAARFASTYGGHLVTVANAEENEFVRSLIPNGKVSCIGASDWTEEGIWKWIVTGETFNYANWDVNEPNNFDNKETVAIMGDNGFWYDTTDSYADDNLLFIIEYEPMIETELEYNGNKYQLFNAAPSWSIAKEYCEMLGGHLATVSNADENKAISNNLIKNKSYYLGATDAKNEGVWEWVTNESFEYAYWNEGEPNNEYNNENVLEIGYLGKWYDISDHLYVNDIRGFICEFEKKQIESISLDTQDKELAIGEEFKLTASVYPEDIESEVLVWTSSNPAVAEVSTDGSVKAVGYGSTAIKAADGTGTVFDICTITVPESMQEPEVAVESISIDKEHIELEEGELEQLIATLMPENASNKTVIWTSSDKSVAEVDEDGFVFGISRGTATITGTVADGGHSVSCEVTVIDATSVIIDDPSDEDSIIISADSMRANAGDTVDIKLSISNNRGFSSLGIEVDYDSDVMELINAVDGGVGASFTTAQYFTAKPYNMQWDSANNINFNGVLAILTFRMKDNIKDGVYPVSISSYKGKNGDYVDGADINYNEDFEPISIVYYEGAVTVSSRMSGDVNGDNKVNNKDATCLLRYLAGWEQTGIVTEALDIDASGKINSKDATVLLRYIAGWDVVLN